VWQAQVIAKQNAVIHMMQTRFGGWAVEVDGSRRVRDRGTRARQ